ncbi:ATP-binding protein [Yersinia sp. 2553 StPb PI]|uniref:ATP-binding protein n=1 Tax=Yersinia sp. 2553 StPb PI TaxID=3117411 RepID=UPI003FA4592D
MINGMPTIWEQSMRELNNKARDLEAELNFSSGIIATEDRHFTRGFDETQNCPTHGNYTSIGLTCQFSDRVVERRSRCPDCISDEINQVGGQIQDIRIKRLTAEAHISPRFEHCNFDNYQPVNEKAASNLEVCKSYATHWPQVKGSGTSLLLCGSCGTGKNHLAVAMTKQIINEHQDSVLLTSVMRITRAIKRTWQKDSENTEDDIYHLYSSLDLLIIDEVGVQFGSEAEKLILFEIINTRYENFRPTILISNLTVSELTDVIGERIVDRMSEGGGATLVFNWDSFRKDGAA